MGTHAVTRSVGQLGAIGEYVRRRLQGYAGAVVFHYRGGRCERIEYNVIRAPSVSIESFAAVAEEVDDEMRGQTGSVTVTCERGRFGKPRYRVFEPYDALPR